MERKRSFVSRMIDLGMTAEDIQNAFQAYGVGIFTSDPMSCFRQAPDDMKREASMAFNRLDEFLIGLEYERDRQDGGAGNG